MKPIIAVAGSKGQLGWELERLATECPQYDFIFHDKTSLDIADATQVAKFFSENKPDIFINCAAYTAVDKAETEQETAYAVNAEALRILALECKKHDTVLVSFSTDYVFDGEGTKPWKEDDATAPVNYYGYTKRAGEELALNNWEKTIIIRTSWVYSAHGHNFVKTMLRLMKERKEISVVNDQVGSPTYAKDLAGVIMHIVDALTNSQSPIPDPFGIFHYSNDGVITWFDFAVAIQQLSGLACTVTPIPTTAFPTPAKRPAYSVMDKQKIVSVFGVELKDWRSSLKHCLDELQ